MRLENRFGDDDTAQHFLMALRGNYMFVPTFAEQERVPAPPPLNFYIRPKDKALDQETRGTFLSHLRKLTDGWIETGRGTGDGDEPSKRKLTMAIKRVLNKWASGNKPDIGFEESGEWVLRLPVCKTNFTGEGMHLEPVDAAKQEAVRRFAEFLDSPYRYRLCKCRVCDEYYYTQRQPKGFIKYGTHCPRHRHSVSARRSYDAKQGPAQEEKLEVAARHWGTWPKDLERDEVRQAQWIANKVSEGVSSKWTPVKRNWVTLHRTEIEARSAGRKSTEMKDMVTEKGTKNARS